MNIFDELNHEYNPYKILGILENSNNATIKEAYKLKKQNVSPDQKELVEISYNLIKTEELRIRYSIIGSRPLESLDEVKKYGYKPKKTETTTWFNLITES